MANDKRTGWLLDLKVDDTVACDGWGFGRSDYEIGKITSITPTGTIRVVFDGRTTVEEFRPDGRRKSDARWDHHALTPYTEDLKAKLLHVAKVRAASYYLDRRVVDVDRLDALPDARLDELTNMLRQFRRDKTEE